MEKLDAGTLFWLLLATVAIGFFVYQTGPY